MKATRFMQTHQWAGRCGRAPKASSGFSLVELMVAMAIGGIAVVIVMQVFLAAEKNKRTTMGGDDVLTSGTVAFMQIQSALRQSGQGLSSPLLIGCSLSGLPSTKTATTLAPAIINHSTTEILAGDANTDTLRVMYGSGNGSPEGDFVVSVDAGNLAKLTVSAPAAFAQNDYVIAANQTRPATCALTLRRVKAAPVGAVVELTTALPSTSFDTLFNLGPNPRFLAFSVRSGRLTQCDVFTSDCSLAANWAELSEGVVSLRAQYGLDTDAPMDAQFNAFNQVTVSSQCDVAKVLAVRMALVVRNAEAEKSDQPTTSQPTWAGSTGTNTHPVTLTGPAGDTDAWKRYRYRVLESTAPIRNITWQGVVGGC
jgi:type IV pilus assembly protein PilW